MVKYQTRRKYRKMMNGEKLLRSFVPLARGKPIPPRPQKELRLLNRDIGRTNDEISAIEEGWENKHLEFPMKQYEMLENTKIMQLLRKEELLLAIDKRGVDVSEKATKLQTDWESVVKKHKKRLNY